MDESPAHPEVEEELAFPEVSTGKSVAQNDDSAAKRVRLRLRANCGSNRPGVALGFALPIDRDVLIQTAADKLGTDTHTPVVAARLYLGEHGDELDSVQDIRDDDLIYVSFDGSAFREFNRPAQLGAERAAAFRNAQLAVDRTRLTSSRPMNRGSTISKLPGADVHVTNRPGLGNNSEPAQAVWGRKAGKKFAVFVSHAKAEAAMEARFVQSWLEDKLGSAVFIDSDDLQDLNQLKQHVKDSAVLVIVQSKSVLTRPYCLIELLTAVKHRVPIVGLCLSGVGVRAQYDFADASHYLTHIDEMLEDNPSAIKMLAENGYDDLVEVAYLLANVIPNRISIPLCPGGSAVAIAATLEQLVGLIQKAQPVDLDELPKQESWLRCRSVKAWGSWQEVLTDHLTFTKALPKMIGAYIGPCSLSPAMIESVMLAVNSINLCPFCTGLHGDLGRMAGLQNPLKLMASKSTDECLDFCDVDEHKPAVRYARTFAMIDGRGPKHTAAYAELVEKYDTGQAESVRALCWLLYWGSYTGNTLSGAIGHKTAKPGTTAVFNATFSAYYALLFFGAITVLSGILKMLPRMPALVSSTLGE